MRDIWKKWIVRQLMDRAHVVTHVRVGHLRVLLRSHVCDRLLSRLGVVEIAADDEHKALMERAD